MDKILLVDDEISILKALERLLRREGYQVYTAENAELALLQLEVTPCQVVISDYRMPGMNGGALLRQIHSRFPQTVCMILSGYADFNAIIELLNAGVAFRFLQKPWDDKQLLTEVQAAFYKYHACRSEQIRSQFLMSSGEPLLEVSNDGLIHRSNAALQRFLQLSAAELTGSNILKVFPFLSAESLENFLALKQAFLIVSRSNIDYEFIIQKADKDVILLKLQTLDELPQLVSNTVNLPMVLDQKSVIQEIDNLLYCQEPFAVVSLQVRDFNLMADIIGIYEAEQVFESLAAALLESISGLGRLAYLANEQFIVLFPAVVSESILHQQILSLLQLLDGKQLVKGKLVQLGLSVAYAIGPHDGQSGKALLNNVLLTSRLNSKGRLDFFMRYSASLTENKKHQIQLSEALYYAVENEELSLVFQPKWDLATQQIVGAEALLRWNSKIFGSVSPAVFIPIAEQDGQITELGNWVIHRACQYLTEWKLNGQPLMPLAVNVSALQLQNPAFIKNTLELINATAADVRYLQLEITESAVMNDLLASQRQLQALRDAGFSLAIDDFGTGYSSLAYLARLPVDTLKIDRSLILDLEGSISTQTMLQNIIRMAHDLQQKVVVEGVETVEQLHLLQQMHCDQAQGFYLSRPLAEPAYLALINVTEQETRFGEIP